MAWPTHPLTSASPERYGLPWQLHPAHSRPDPITLDTMWTRGWAQYHTSCLLAVQIPRGWQRQLKCTQVLRQCLAHKSYGKASERLRQASLRGAHSCLARVAQA
eukprot:CAMPEP_0115859610 /NCGR_PEP_ID=MMETSP0287-20121206/16704_1 /TAXON_ID=412157 /ORGANISM="Chrysochromulina rotalis, Strain UIO044" /LENGTH=103 /DNA_ID=CAMNT_0003313915 /DNA_START=110 /DNA_END=421 /DNA_ORIENTATION=-